MQKRYVSIWFPHLATDWFSARQASLKNTAFVLTAPFHNRMIVTAASPKAQQQGIVAGLSLADARAVLPSLQYFDDKPNLTTQLLQRIAEWCIRFTPAAAPDEPAGLVLDATGCTHLWGGEEAYLTDIINRIAARGYTAHAALADTIGAAWAVARFGKAQRVIESGQQYQALSSLPAAALRLDAETVARLQKLGLYTVASFFSMPRTALRRRFGQTIVQRIAQALGEEEETFLPVYPVQHYEERLPCIEPIVTRTGIEIAMEQLVQMLCGRLRKEGKGLRAAYFRCYRTDSTAQGIEIATSRPSHHKEHLYHLFGLKLSALEPKNGIELFVLQATSVEDHTPKQESFWETSGRVNNEELSQLIDRIGSRFGKEVVFRFGPAEHYLPEHSYQPIPPLLEAKPGQWPTHKPRPVQLLPIPERIDVAAPVPDYPPMNFRYKGKLHKIVKADGPERIEQEWWVQEGEHRDYYAVEDQEGRRYWLFRLGHYTGDKTHQWFLHGFFA